MAPQTTSQPIAYIGPQQWSGRPGKDVHNHFFGAGIIALVACLILTIFIPPLQNPGAVFIVCPVFALGTTIWDITTTMRREKRFLTALTEAINEFIVESTGDRTSLITVTRFRELIEFGGKLPLTINGVPCLDLTVAGKAFEARHVMATVTAADYGLGSFDHLLQEEQKRKA
jgi:hypothetical protein